MTYQCETCGRTWDDQLAVENDLYCTRRCGGQLLVVEIDRQCHLDDIDFGRLPYCAGATVQCLSAVDPAGRFVAGTEDGQLHFLTIRGDDRLRK